MTVDVSIFLIMALSTWRISKVISDEEGPFSVFSQIRDRFSQGGKWGWVGRGLRCMWCISFWVGLSLSFLIGQTVFYGLALSSFAIFFDEKGLRHE